jgi:drug/metabolite transporter (DMT)-like permease
LTVGGGAAALAGLVLVLNPGTGGVAPIGVLWGLLAAGGLAVYFVLASRVDDALPPIALAWLGMIVGAVALIACDSAHVLAFRMHTHDVQLFHRSASWIVPVVGLSLVAAAIAYASGIVATRLLGAKLASFVGLTEVLFAVLFAWLVLGQRPGVGQFIGGLVVLMGIALVRVDELRADAPAPEPVLAEPAR